MPVNHSYFIAINLPEPLHTEISEIKKGISEKYNTRSVLKSPPHITLVPPFFWGNEEELIGLVQQFTYPEFKVELDGYQAFPIGVVYIDIKQNEKLYDLHQQFNALFFGRYPQLKKRHPFPFQPHVTVGNRDWKKEQFNKCWNDFKEEKFEGDFTFQKLSLLKNVNGLWKVV
jgi:2'-5' RNA ligase